MSLRDDLGKGYDPGAGSRILAVLVALPELRDLASDEPGVHPALTHPSREQRQERAVSATLYPHQSRDVMGTPRSMPNGRGSC